jgi:hypothetical protein
MDWKKTFSFLSPKYVTHKVQGQELHFYSASPKVLFELRTIAEPLVRALAVLLRDSSKDVGQKQTTRKTKDGEVSEIIVEPISPELVERLEKEKQAAFKDLLDVVTSQDSAMALGMLFLDALRDDRPENYTRNDAKEFVQAMDLSVIKEMLEGVIKANKGHFAPLADLLKAAMGELGQS